MINKTKISSPLCVWSLPLSSATASWPLSSHNFIHSYLLSYHSAYIVESLPLMSDHQLLSLTSLIKVLQLICTLQTVFLTWCLEQTPRLLSTAFTVRTRKQVEWDVFNQLNIVSKFFLVFMSV